MTLVSWYYAVWRDGINAVQNSKAHLSIRWRYIVLVYMFSVAQGMKLILILFLLRPYCDLLPSSHDLGLGVFFNNFFHGFGFFIAPFVVMNYFLVFHNGKYKQLLSSKPEEFKGRIFMGYFVISAAIFIGALIVGKALS